MFVDGIGLKDLAIVGWSMGGAVAMQFVADYPDYCTQLVLLASASTRGFPFVAVNADGSLGKRCETMEEIEADYLRTIPIQGAYDAKIGSS